MIFFILAFAICRIRFQYFLWYGGLCDDKNNYSKTSEYEFFVVIIAPSRFACFVVLNFMFIRLLFTCIVKHLQFSFVFSFFHFKIISWLSDAYNFNKKPAGVPSNQLSDRNLLISLFVVIVFLCLLGARPTIYYASVIFSVFFQSSSLHFHSILIYSFTK